jgi:hypothetical protein
MFTTVEETLLVILRSPSSVTTIVLALAGFVLFTDTHKTWYRSSAASATAPSTWRRDHDRLAHGPGRPRRRLGVQRPRPPGLTLVALFVGGWLIGSLLMGLYLLTSVNLFGRHSTESFSSIAVQDYKLFLRLTSTAPASSSSTRSASTACPGAGATSPTPPAARPASSPTTPTRAAPRASSSPRSSSARDAQPRRRAAAHAP